jgi:hypothetical protein
MALDRVLSDFFDGSGLTLGEVEGTSRLDSGEGMDHRALACALLFRPHG